MSVLSWGKFDSETVHTTGFALASIYVKLNAAGCGLYLMDLFILVVYKVLYRCASGGTVAMQGARHQVQLGAQNLAQGHFGMWTG